MELQIGNVIWTLLLFTTSYLRTFYLIILTIGIEIIPIYYLFQEDLKASAILSVVGNLISGILGVFIVSIVHQWAYIKISHNKKYRRKLSYMNWMRLTFVTFCLGSVLIEIIAIHIFYEINFLQLIVPLGLGNVISYLMIYLINRKYMLNDIKETFGDREKP